MSPFYFFFFFNDTATTEIYTLSLHDALPIYDLNARAGSHEWGYVEPSEAAWEILEETVEPVLDDMKRQDRKSTRLNSSHSQISYAVFCLKKKTTSIRTLM